MAYLKKKNLSPKVNTIKEKLQMLTRAVETRPSEIPIDVFKHTAPPSPPTLVSQNQKLATPLLPLPEKIRKWPNPPPPLLEI